MENNFIDKIDDLIKTHHLLNHSFYKAWTAGELPKETIREYAAQYFQHVSMFPRYLSSIHSNCEEINIRQLLLENLNEEEIKILQTLVKQRKESIELYEKGKRNELVAIERQEMEIINSYLPKMMSDDSIKNIVKSISAI